MTVDELRRLPLQERLDFMVKTFGPTQERFAPLVGTSRERVNAWVNGRSSPSAEYAEKIARLGDYPVELFAPESTIDWLVREVVATRNELAEVRAMLASVDVQQIGGAIAAQLEQQARLLRLLGETADNLAAVVARLEGRETGGGHDLPQEMPE